MAELIDPGPIEFEAELHGDEGSGAACWVDFPHDLKATYGKGNLVPIRATFDGAVTYQGSLAKMGGACAMLLVRKDVLAQLGKGRGDRVHARVELDPAPRVVELPEDARAAVDAVPAAAATWERLSPSHRREYARWIEEAKKPETRVRRIERTVALLADGKPLRP